MKQPRGKYSFKDLQTGARCLSWPWRAADGLWIHYELAETLRALIGISKQNISKGYYGKV